MKDWSSDR